MPRVLNKYQLPIQNAIELELTEGALFLSAAAQFDAPTLWAVMDPSAPAKTYSFVMVQDGAAVPDNAAYIGTIQLRYGSLTYHLFCVWKGGAV